MAERVIAPNEVYLASRHPTTGAVLREGRFRLAPNSNVSPTLQGLSPPIIAIGEQGRDTQPFAASITFEDNSGGIGVYNFDPRQHVNRIWWSTTDIRRRRQTTLLKKKTDRDTPASIGSRQPRVGGDFNNKVWVAWDERAYSWTGSGGWSAIERTFTSNATPSGDPIEWEGGWFWFLGSSGIDVYNGTTWWNIALSAVGGVIYGSSLYVVSGGGAVKIVTAATASAKIAAGTLAAGDFTGSTTVSDTCTGLLLFTTADADADVVPHIIGSRSLYQYNTATGAITPTGPQLPPHRFDVRATVLGTDNAAYISQGMSVVQWTGQVAQSVGLDNDDGVPFERRGGIVRLVNGGQSLFALIDSTSAAGSSLLDIYGTDPGYADVLGSTTGYSWLASRDGSGWMARATSDAQGTAPTLLFVSTAEDTYRLWFAWDATAYTIDLEQGLFNPLDDPTGEYEATGELIYSVVTFGVRELSDVGVLLEVRTRNCSANAVVSPYIQYDESGTWYELYNADGSFGITTNGRHSFFLHANPVPTDPPTNLVFADDPPVGHSFDEAQIKMVLTGASSTDSPAVVFTSIHAVQSTAAITGWSMTLDLSTVIDGRSPWQQRELLLNLILDNEDGLLHFAYHPDPDAALGAAEVHPVKVLNYRGLENTGMMKDFKGRVQLSLSEVTVDV